MELTSSVLLAARAPDDDGHIVGDRLTSKQESFARVWAETDNQAVAYRKVYSVGERTKPETIWANASRIGCIPHVRARYRELRELSLLETIVSVRELFQWYVDIATADPNEIVRTRKFCCRFCYGESHAYQWKDIAEFTRAVTAWTDRGGKDEGGKLSSGPDMDGGFGFDPFLEPNVLCTECLGGGIERVQIADTSKLEGKARRLYKGAKQDRFGCIEVLLHDQDKAREQIGRMLGAFKDVVDLRSPGQRANEAAKSRIPDNVTEGEAAKLYLERLA